MAVDREQARQRGSYGLAADVCARLAEVPPAADAALTEIPGNRPYRAFGGVAFHAAVNPQACPRCVCRAVCSPPAVVPHLSGAQEGHTSQWGIDGANSANGILGARSVRARLTLGDTPGDAGGLSIMDNTRQERAPAFGR